LQALALQKQPTVVAAQATLAAAGALDNCPLSLVEQHQSEDCRLDKPQVVLLDLSRRPEDFQAYLGTEVTDLDVGAHQAPVVPNPLHVHGRLRHSR
jgi:hypothetical protein